MSKRDAFYAAIFGMSLLSAVAFYALGEKEAAAGLVILATGQAALRSPFTRDPGPPDA